MAAHAISAPRAAAHRLPLRHSLLSDERLAGLVATGDERAFATLYERYHQPLYRYCRSMLRHDADAQDALQSAMTGAYTALHRSQRDAPLRPWLFRIAHNEAISVLRRRRPAAELTDGNGGFVASASEQGEHRERLALLVADLRELPERQRSALVMRELSGLSHEDIAIALGTSVGGAKQAIFEARRALSEFVEGRAMSCDEVCRLVSDADGRVLRGRRVRAHLRDCAGCSAFAAAIPGRTTDLRALAPPLPAIAAAGLLTHVLGGSSSVGTGGAGIGSGGAGIASALTGKTVALGVVTKAVASLAILSAATFGITTAVEHATRATHHSPAQVVHRSSSRSAASSSSTAGTTSVGRGAVSASPGSATGQAHRQHGQTVASSHGGGLARAGSTTRSLTLPATSSAPSHASPASAVSAGTTGSRAGSIPGTTVSGTHRSTQSQRLLPPQPTQHAPQRTVTTPLSIVPPGF